LTIRSDEARERTEASFRKEERAKESTDAMMEYQANSRAVEGASIGQRGGRQGRRRLIIDALKQTHPRSTHLRCGLIGQRRAACTGSRKTASGSFFRFIDSPDRAECLALAEEKYLTHSNPDTDNSGRHAGSRRDRHYPNRDRQDRRIRAAVLFSVSKICHRRGIRQLTPVCESRLNPQFHWCFRASTRKQ
jgi:hypothetical protein